MAQCVNVLAQLQILYTPIVLKHDRHLKLFKNILFYFPLRHRIRFMFIIASIDRIFFHLDRIYNRAYHRTHKLDYNNKRV